MKLSFCTPWRYMGGIEIQLHSFLASMLEGVERSASLAGCLTPPGGGNHLFSLRRLGGREWRVAEPIWMFWGRGKPFFCYCRDWNWYRPARSLSWKDHKSWPTLCSRIVHAQTVGSHWNIKTAGVRAKFWTLDLWNRIQDAPRVAVTQFKDVVSTEYRQCTSRIFPQGIPAGGFNLQIPCVISTTVVCGKVGPASSYALWTQVWQNWVWSMHVPL